MALSVVSPLSLPTDTVDNNVIYGVCRERQRIAPSEAQGKGKPKGGNFPTELSGYTGIPPGKGWPSPGSEFCVVARDGGTKRKQPVLRPWDRAPKSLVVAEALRVP